MPKQYKKSKKSSSCSSSQSRSDSYSSSSSKGSCKEEKCKPATCSAKVAVETDVCTKVKCDEVCQRNAKYDVGVCIDAQPSCRIKPICSKQISPCRVECILQVDLDVAYKCKAKPFNGTSFPKAEFALDVTNDFKTRCAK